MDYITLTIILTIYLRNNGKKIHSNIADVEVTSSG